MKGTEFIVRSLVADGVDHLFMVPGGLIDPFLAALPAAPGIRPVIAAQEGGAAYMADGYARASGRFGACLGIGGPGLTNAVTAISAAFSDGSPVLVLSGEVATYMEGLGQFQDATAGTFDDSAILASVTAQSYSVPDVRLLHHDYNRALERMFDTAAPVHLSLPGDVQTGEVAAAPMALAPDLLGARTLDVAAAERLWTVLAGGDGPAGVRLAILAGSPLGDDEAADLRAVAERFHLPVATSEIAKGVIAEDHELSLGVFGYAGTRHATDALLGDQLDLLIVIESALNQRDSMHWSGRLAPRLGMVSVNPLAARLAYHSEPLTFVRGHGGAFLRWLLAAPPERTRALEDGIGERRSWVERIRSEPRLYDAENRDSDQIPIHPARVVADCRRVLPRETIALVDSGAHRAFAVHYWDSYRPREFLTAAALGPMGWAIAAGVGAKAARPEAPVVVFTGDGCMQMHGIEIQTAARFDLPVIFVVSNNAALGNVWLRARTIGPLAAQLTETADHDWAGFARSLGLEAATVRRPDELVLAIERALGLDRAFLIDVKTDRTCTTPVEPYRKAAAEWSYQE